MKSTEFSELRAFVEVAAHRSFARAAVSLHLNRSTLSQVIRELEERLGTRLLNRTTRSVALTDAVQKLFTQLKPALESLETAAQLTTTGPAGLLKVQTPRMVMETELAPRLADFHHAYPQIVLDLTINDANTDIVAGGFDIGIRLGEFLEKDMRAVPLTGAFTQVAFASPKYLAKHGRPKTPEDLHQHVCINWRQPTNQLLYAWEFRRRNKWFSVAVEGPLIVSDRRFMVEAVLQHLGIGFWTLQRIEPHVKAGRLEALLERFTAPFPGYFAYYPKQRVTSPAVRAFVDFFRQR